MGAGSGERGPVTPQNHSKQMGPEMISMGFSASFRSSKTRQASAKSSSGGGGWGVGEREARGARAGIGSPKHYPLPPASSKRQGAGVYQSRQALLQPGLPEPPPHVIYPESFEVVATPHAVLLDLPASRYDVSLLRYGTVGNIPERAPAQCQASSASKHGLLFRRPPK